jgi:hypothetical protein
LGNATLNCATAKQILDCPSVICESCRVRWRQAERTMNVAEVEMRHKQGNSMAQVFHLF